MAKVDKAIPEEVLIEEEPRLVAALAETAEQRDERLKREDYQRRNLAAMDEYEKITGLPHPSRQNPDAAVNQRCCF